MNSSSICSNLQVNIILYTSTPRFTPGCSGFFSFMPLPIYTTSQITFCHFGLTLFFGLLLFIQVFFLMGIAFLV